MKLRDPNLKLAGLLAPVFALRHSQDFGIGDTLAVRDAIDFCAEQGFTVLQILPVHETVGDHSPYSPITSRGLSPALLWLSPEAVPGLTDELLQRFAPESWLAHLRAGTVKNNAVHALKLHVLLAAHRAFCQSGDISEELRRSFAAFKEANASWLPAYALFRLLIREYEGNTHWPEWRPEHQTLGTAERWFSNHPDRDYLAGQRDGLAYIQWVAARQWQAVREYADARRVLIMGEVSFGVSRSSVDVWANPELFDCEWSMGTPPIAYFDTNKDSERWGQNWGLPPYPWENHRSSGFAWLRERIQAERQFFHICRLDHLRGYFRAYMFPWPGGARHSEFNQLTEEEVLQRTGGRWPRFVPGPDDDPSAAQMNDLQGREVISVIQEAAGDMYLIAEIMGDMPAYIAKALDDLNMPSLIFPQLERGSDRSLRPPNSYRRLSLGSYANHDHAPLAALYGRLMEQARENPTGPAAIDLRNLLQFAGWTHPPPADLHSELLARFQQVLFETPCQLTALMTSDLLGISQRFNLPGSYGSETWNERLEIPLADYAAHPEFGPRIGTAKRLIAETGRLPAPG